MNVQRMVLGFIFSNDNSKVVLCKKKKPKWQKGKYNGVGGKVEEEDNLDLSFAMRREAYEETGLSIDDWTKCITFTCAGGIVHVFSTYVHPNVFERIKSGEEEIRVFDVNKLPKTVIPNLKWMVPMLLDTIEWPIHFEYDLYLSEEEEE